VTLSASNGSDDFDITAFFFNVSADVTDVSLQSGPRDWKLSHRSAENARTDTGEFGVFDYVVWVKDRKANKGKIKSGNAATFVLEVTGAGAITAEDFTSEVSTTESGEVAAFGAARFGIDGDSPIGATHAPEPTTGLLLGMGMCMLAATRRGR
jgi:hypothetical protein